MQQGRCANTSNGGRERGTGRVAGTPHGFYVYESDTQETLESRLECGSEDTRAYSPKPGVAHNSSWHAAIQLCFLSPASRGLKSATWSAAARTRGRTGPTAARSPARRRTAAGTPQSSSAPSPFQPASTATVTQLFTRRFDVGKLIRAEFAVQSPARRRTAAVPPLSSSAPSLSQPASPATATQMFTWEFDVGKLIRAEFSARSPARREAAAGMPRFSSAPSFFQPVQTSATK